MTTGTPDHYLQAANGTPIAVYGVTKLPIEINKHLYLYPTHIVDGITHDLILGKDFLTNYGGVINLRDGLLTLNAGGDVNDCSNQTIPSATAQQDICEVYAKRNITLQPRSEAIITQFQEYETKTGTYLFEPNSILNDDLQIQIEPAILDARKRNLVWKVTNPGMEPKELKIGAHLGCIMPLPPGEYPALNLVTKPTDKTKTYHFHMSSALNPSEQNALVRLLEEYRDIFSTSPRDLGRTNLAKHNIDTGNAAPIRKPPYRVSPSQRQEIDKHVREMLDKNVIKPSTSPWASPILLVKKPNGTNRFCIDFRGVNKITTKDSHPLPRIDDTLDALHGAKYFTTLDMLSGYWQVELTEEAKPKTAFITHQGLYECEVTLKEETFAEQTFAISRFFG